MSESPDHDLGVRFERELRIMAAEDKAWRDSHKRDRWKLALAVLAIVTGSAAFAYFALHSNRNTVNEFRAACAGEVIVTDAVLYCVPHVLHSQRRY